MGFKGFGYSEFGVAGLGAFKPRNLLKRIDRKGILAETRARVL